MINRSAIKKYSKKNGIKLSKKAEFYLLKNIDDLIHDILILSAKEAAFKGRRIISEEDMNIVLKKLQKI